MGELDNNETPRPRADQRREHTGETTRGYHREPNRHGNADGDANTVVAHEPRKGGPEKKTKTHY